MSANDSDLVQKSIKIMQIDSPHKFWYKYCNDSVQDRLIEELEREIAAYAADSLTRDEHLPTLDNADVIAAHHPGWNKWIRGKPGRKKKAKKDGEVDSIYIWAIDYGCKLLLPLTYVIPLENMRLAYRRPINVHIGGISNIVPASLVCCLFIQILRFVYFLLFCCFVWNEIVQFFVCLQQFNEVLFDTEKVKCLDWSKKSIELFKEWISDQTELTFLIESVESSRCFGQVLINGQNNNEPFSVAAALCELNEAILDRKYKNGECFRMTIG